MLLFQDTRESILMSCTFIQKLQPRKKSALTLKKTVIYYNFRPSGETWRGKWQGNEIAAKILALRECTPRISRDFNEEYPKLRYESLIPKLIPNLLFSFSSESSPTQMCYL